MALAATAFGWSVAGAGEDRRELARHRAGRARAPPPVDWRTFAPDVPPAGAASIGRTVAPIEILLVLDPEQESARRLLDEAATLGEDVVVRIFAPGERGADLVLAHRDGKLAAWPEYESDERAMVLPIVEHQARGLAAAGVSSLPAALWNGGSRSGAFTLAEVADAARDAP
jgi:hypothetical protein